MKSKKLLIIVLCLALIFASGIVINNKVEAKATKKAMKFLKGTWITVGNSQSVKLIFTKKYVKSYDLWNKNYTKVYSPKHKGKYLGKRRIDSTKKKGKTWIIKVGKKGQYTYYKGFGVGLECWWKEKGKWQYSGSSSLQRYSKKVYK